MTFRTIVLCEDAVSLCIEDDEALDAVEREVHYGLQPGQVTRSNMSWHLPNSVTPTTTLKLTMALSRFKLVFFVSEEDTQRVLKHLFQKFPDDVGRIGNYEQCAFIQRGTGPHSPCSPSLSLGTDI